MVKREVIIWAVSITAALIIFGIFLTWDAYLSNEAQKVKTIKEAAEKIINTNTAKEDPGKITQFEIQITKIGVSAPVIPNVDGKSEAMYDEALNYGVAHFKGTALPNSGSNIFIFGHSSSVLGTGKYDKIFAKLGNIISGDEIEIKYNGKTYMYKVIKKEVVTADDTSVIDPTIDEQLTLMTCWPVGTDQKRLIIIANPTK